MTPSVQAGRERYLLESLLALTAVTGLIDAVSFLGLGRIFTANMTGNIVLLGFALAGVQGLSVLRSGAAVVAFAGGSVIGARLTKKDRPAARQLLIALGCEVGLLAAAAIVALRATGEVSSVAAYLAITCTAIAMGLRSAAVRRIAVPDMTTTVLTGTLVALAADSIIAGGHGAGSGRRALSILAMIAGAFSGALLLDRFSVTVALVAGAAADALVALYVWRSSAALSAGR